MTYLKIDIPKVEERYIIYDNGKIFDKKRNKYCNKHLNHKGYHTVWIATVGKTLSVHRLVLCKYCPTENEIYLQVNHIDGNKTNNNLDNLEWVTQSENQKHAYSLDLINRKGERNSQSKLTELQVKEIISDLLNEIPAHKIADKYNVSKSLITRIRTKRAWIYLTKDINFPKSKYTNHCQGLCIENEEELLLDLQNDVDIDIISNKYHLSKRFIHDFKYRKLGKY